MSVESIKYEAERTAREAGFTKDAVHVMPDGSDGWRSPRGQFEGEQWYAPYYWAQILDGAGDDIYPVDAEEDDDPTPGSLLKIDSDESEAFGLECGHWILVRQDSQGFVLVTIHETREEAEKKYRDWMGR